ncbi:Pycsar system effector family protein [Arthrobacter tumbae]|uniref:Pycsar system effector family protein n=1 Tax=Arthrobacter tumbae TaxID=163874 RepID=UPI00195D4433|nr:Pycsar system effector family protein [Arthrobacter tumbae]MBM7780534.1 hypothetical protein [Arthrobacter tumbae]
MTDSLDRAAAQESWNLLTLVNEWVKHAEAKLGVIFAFLGVLAAGLIVLVLEAERPSFLLLSLEGVAGLFLLLAAFCASAGLLPQYSHQPCAGQLNPLYYSDIAHHYTGKEDDYLLHLSATVNDPQLLVKHLAQQVLANAKVAQRKYLWANRAILMGFAALIGTLAVAIGVLLCW